MTNTVTQFQAQDRIQAHYNSFTFIHSSRKLVLKQKLPYPPYIQASPTSFVFHPEFSGQLAAIHVKSNKQISSHGNLQLTTKLQLGNPASHITTPITLSRKNNFC